MLLRATAVIYIYFEYLGVMLVKQLVVYIVLLSSLFIVTAAKSASFFIQCPKPRITSWLLLDSLSYDFCFPVAWFINTNIIVYSTQVAVRLASGLPLSGQPKMADACSPRQSTRPSNSTKTTYFSIYLLFPLDTGVFTHTVVNFTGNCHET